MCHHEGGDVWGAVKDWAVVVVGVAHGAVKVPEYGGTRGVRWRRCDWIAVVSIAENAVLIIEEAPCLLVFECV